MRWATPWACNTLLTLAETAIRWFHQQEVQMILGLNVALMILLLAMMLKNGVPDAWIAWMAMIAQ